VELSRRRLLTAGAGSLVLTLLPVPGFAQSSGASIEVVEKQLKAKLSDDAKKLLSTSLAGLNQVSAARQRFALPENSEPATIFRAVPARKLT